MFKPIRPSEVSAHGTLDYLLVAFVAMVGLAYLNFLPAVVDALVYGMELTEAQAGQVVALNGYGALLGLMAAALLSERLPWRTLLFGALAMLCGLDFSTVWLNDYSLMLVWRCVGGALGGMSVGIAFTVLAKLRKGDRAFGLLLLMQFGIGSLVIYALPTLRVWGGELAVFYVMSALCALGLICTLLLPSFKGCVPFANGSERQKGQPPQKRIRANTLLLLLAMSAYLIAASAIWTYVGQIGHTAGFDEVTVNISIAVTGLLGLAGAMLPVIGVHRFGRSCWLAAGVVLSFCSAVLLCFSAHLFAYVIAMSLLFFSWPAVHSYFLALITQDDTHTTLASIAALLSYGALATGPMLGSLLLRDERFLIMLCGCALLFALSFLLLLKPVHRYQVSDYKRITPSSRKHAAR
ncbi:MFS transporter [Pseudoalteromonas sp. T1lg23B]|uniref:MFS transporter n=1 Tax=Pseudoalteromonas sp. T1lg23B TaxID=2077097 RepID=UPI000CF65B36|nr:MFS transporter [Pseudoalteromonas sp. T1lg23B]